MLHHQTEVGGDIRLALYGIDNDTLSLGRWRRRELDKRRETGATHTHNASFLDTVDNLFGREFRMRLNGLQFIGAVDTFFPFVALDIDDYHWLAIACGVDGSIDLKNGTADG